MKTNIQFNLDRGALGVDRKGFLEMKSFHIGNHKVVVLRVQEVPKFHVTE